MAARNATECWRLMLQSRLHEQETRELMYGPNLHDRRSIRLQGYDYAQAGAYFVTLVAQRRECLFGDVESGEMRLNDRRLAVSKSWEWLAQQYSYVVLDEWVVMPNHLHGIILISDDRGGGSRTAPTSDDAIGAANCRGEGGRGRGGSGAAPEVGTPPISAKRKPLGSLVGAFKTVSTKRINGLRDTQGVTVWQRNYFEHIIRSERSLAQLREYVAYNALKWDLDQLHPNNPSKW